jgi:hypothetical protein
MKNKKYITNKMMDSAIKYKLINFLLDNYKQVQYLLLTIICKYYIYYILLIKLNKLDK